MTDRERQDLALAYAAGVLEEPEQAAVRRRIDAGDLALVGAIAEAEAFLARLSATAPAVQPSADVKARLMDRLPDRPPAGPLRINDRQPSRLVRMALAAGVGGLLIGGVAAYLAWDRQQHATQLASQLTGQRNDAESLRQELDAARLDAARQAIAVADLRRLLGSGDVRLASMAAPQAPAGEKPRGRVVWDVQNKKWHVYFFDLKPPPPGRVYQLWLLPGGNAPPVPAPTFQVNAGGAAQFVVDLPAGATPAAAAVSDEPPGGSTAPTGTILLVGNL